MKIKTGNTGITFLVMLLFIVTIVLSICLLVDSISENVNVNYNQIENMLTEHKVSTEKSYKIGEKITLKDGSKWIVLADSPAGQDYVTVLGSEDYVDALQQPEWENVYNQFYINFISYKNSALDKFMQSQTARNPATLKEVDGYKIRLIHLYEIFDLDNNFKYNNQTGDYDYTGDAMPDYLKGITTMTLIKGEGTGKMWAYYTAVQTTCHELQNDCIEQYFITTYKSGLGGFYPVVNVYKNSI